LQNPDKEKRGIQPNFERRPKAYLRYLMSEYDSEEPLRILLTLRLLPVPRPADITLQEKGGFTLSFS
jgi:hypothetical protein